MQRRVGIAVYGATGRMASKHHLPGLAALRDAGGLAQEEGRRVVPELVLVGRDAARLAPLAEAFGAKYATTSLDEALADPEVEIYFDAASTAGRGARLLAAARAGKHLYTEKPALCSSAEAGDLFAELDRRGLRHGVVEDKLFLPGIVKARRLRDSGFFGRIHRFHLEFGNWVFDGKEVPCQRSSWNYRKSGGGGIMLDMFPHWRYLVEDLIGPIESLCALAWTATPERIDERGAAYRVDVEDSGLCLLEMAGGAKGSIGSSWATRVRRDETFSLQIDGDKGSAVVGYHRCHAQPAALTPIAASSLARDTGADFRADWQEVPSLAPARDSYRAGWEAFLAHVYDERPLASDLRAGLRDLRFGELSRESAAARRWFRFDV